ncbi:MAG: UDP-glucose/GDP-mannose dehydrogenase family protein [Candidatus Eremiobacteraeota bacterium]|nr:UDP-glucose/GDP-mannose dehydrogenase family protein [Candidatus Eremiobacteraeota bacterium]MBC5801666.1 UDP-glucose/GDP-mannose dehydrogenase family protein [Candidatus Eremiobacteraeota bacterium]MBC5824052.1 UDP-glucose/GDP-mannose dehydrogenase family protein [Candidatus Eremiobacteraeota bacterium]
MSATKKPKRVAIIGTGYVGMACCIGFAEFGHQIVGYDILPERVRALQAGITPYREAGIGESLLTHLLNGRVSFVDDLPSAVSAADFIIVAVGTPSHADGSADITAVENVVTALTQMELHGATVVIRSTVPPGTSEWIADALRGNAHVVFAPEFLREGSAVHDFLNPDRVVVGAESRAIGMRYGDLFEHLSKPVLVMSLRNAELAKGMSNAFLAMKISFANEVANLCDDLDADALDVLEAVGYDKRIGRMFLQPGIGFGGPCFEKDLKSLISVSKSANADSHMLSATLHVNDRQPLRIVRTLIEEMGGSIDGARIGVWGLAFKAGTDDVRDSLALRIVEELASQGAEVVAYDPAIDGSAINLPCTFAGSALEAAEADALLVLTEWPQFRAVDAWALARRLRQKVVVDGRNILDIDAMSAAGIRYRGVGRRRTAESVEFAEAG